MYGYAYMHMHMCASIGINIHEYICMCVLLSSSTMRAPCLSFSIWETSRWTGEEFEFEVVRPPAGEVTGTSHLSQLLLFLPESLLWEPEAPYK